MRVQRSIDIAAPPEKIWPFLVEPEKILKWFTTFQIFEYTGEKRNSIGTTFYVEEKAGPMPVMKLNFRFTEWVENERLAFRMTGGTGAKAYEQGWTIRANPTGSRFTFIEDFELPYGIIGKFIGFVGQPVSASNIKKMLVILKSLAEGKKVKEGEEVKEVKEDEEGVKSNG